MLLSNLIGRNDGLALHGHDVALTGLTEDSRKVEPGFLFIAVPGFKQNGQAFIRQALDQGAVALLVPQDALAEGQIPPGIPVVTASDVRQAIASVACKFYPLQSETIAAITGTSGKTSSVQFTRQLWQHCGRVSASIGTLGLVTAKQTRYGALTTPDPITLHKTLHEAAESGVTHLVMEASSQGIDLHRLDRVHIRLGAFTNLSRDHLDYHESMENYLATKIRLFTHIMAKNGIVALNADGPEFDRLVQACKIAHHTTISFGQTGKDVQLLETEPHPKGQRLRLSVQGKLYTAFFPVAGSFQIANALCALALVLGSGEDPASAVAALEKLTVVPGRLERIGASAKGGTVFVDYAHKPGALENVLTALRAQLDESVGARLHVVFGCGGNRDKGKRPEMGEIAQRLADVAIVTDDNPRNEDPADIRRQILAGCNRSPHVREIADRAQAIVQAVADLRQGDILVIAGKGHETGQIVGNTVLPFDDAQTARRALALESSSS